MKKFYEVTSVWVEEYADSKGDAKERKRREKYLIQANSVTEAEARTVEKFKSFWELEVVSVVESRIIDVVLKEEK